MFFRRHACFPSLCPPPPLIGWISTPAGGGGGWRGKENTQETLLSMTLLHPQDVFILKNTLIHNKSDDRMNFRCLLLIQLDVILLQRAALLLCG